MRTVGSLPILSCFVARCGRLQLGQFLQISGNQNWSAPCIVAFQHLLLDKRINTLSKFQSLRTMWERNLDRQIHECVARSGRLSAHGTFETADQLTLEQFDDETFMIVLISIPFDC